MQSEDKGAPPIASDEKAHFFRDVAVIQPMLEPAPKWVRRLGPLMLFFYCRISCFAVGVDLLRGGGAVHFGPVMLGFVHIQTFSDYASSVEARHSPCTPETPHD